MVVSARRARGPGAVIVAAAGSVGARASRAATTILGGRRLGLARAADASALVVVIGSGALRAICVRRLRAPGLAWGDEPPGVDAGVRLRGLTQILSGQGIRAQGECDGHEESRCAITDGREHSPHHVESLAVTGISEG